ncbi:MAG TPA: polysaccharide deacetylase family protein [Propionibacteriaceae bacterium]|nr:polysaccharide deacetylase family protein [Propionibacteriaceae bacterium]
MSRIPTSFVGLVLAVLVLVFGNAAAGEDNWPTAVVGVSPSAVGPAHPTPANPSATAQPPGAGAPVRKPRSRPSKPAKSRLTQKSQFRPSDKTAGEKLRSRQSADRLAANHGGTVYLTFDDGPSPYTPAILNILRATHSTATFFELGFRQAKYPATPGRVRAEGSSVGNHTYNHPDLTALTAGQIRWQLSHGPRGRCMRPPFGATNSAVRRIVAQQGLREVLWSIDTLDWSRPGTAKIVKAATGPAVRAGSTVLLHDGGGDRSQTVAALPQIIRTLQQRGYVIRRIPGC